jgi:predicted NBD/HSP70 family sugar kinase
MAQCRWEVTMEAGGGRAARIQLDGQLLVLREVHAGRVATRADLNHSLRLARGSASELVGRLRAAHLLDERPAPASGKRGRPTTDLVPHPLGPLVCAADIAHETWTVALFELGGGIAARRSGRHGRRNPRDVLGSVAREIGRLCAPRPDRVRAVGVSIPGTIRGTTVVQASNLGWRGIDVPRHLGARTRRLGAVIVGNDATFAGLAEARRGAAAGVPVSLHLKIDVGVGGVVIDHDRPLVGGTGAGGEFGHLPFGDPSVRCACGAHGCWDQEVDGRALARLLGRRPPRDSRRAAVRILAEAEAGVPDARRAVAAVATAFGRGVAGLVNAVDPDLVTVSGLGADLLDAAEPEIRAAYRRGLMRYRRAGAPPIVPTMLGPDGSLIGAAEAAFDELLSERGLSAWRRA